MIKDFSIVPVILTIHNNTNESVNIFQNQNLLILPDDEVDVRIDKSEYLALILNKLDKLNVEYEVIEISRLTAEQVEAVKNILVECNENLTITFDESILDIDFTKDEDNLFVDNNVEGLTFRINKNNELEAIY